MNEQNLFYELLTNNETRDKIIDSLKVNNFFLAEFLTDDAVINGDTAIYYSSNPATDAPDYAKSGMTWPEDMVFSHSLKVMINKIYQCRVNQDMLRIAVGSSEGAEAIAGMQANGLKKRFDLHIIEKCQDLLVKRENYSDEGWVEMPSNSFDKPDEFLKVLFKTAENMKHPTLSYNKGYKEGSDWKPVTAASGSLKDIVVILNTSKKTQLRVEGSDKSNYSLVDLEREFKAVYDLPLPEEVGGFLLDKEAMALVFQIRSNLIVQDCHDDPLAKKVSLPGFLIGGMVPFVNKVAIVKANATNTSGGNISTSTSTNP